ncbi:MAG TPA: choice-of-anchor D domain-containing protein [Kofleriaceae bacterium]|nr:choice-of-anchor D domain-containing protein [Kofleriaceae bacterium]
MRLRTLALSSLVCGSLAACVSPPTPVPLTDAPPDVDALITSPDAPHVDAGPGAPSLRLVATGGLDFGDVVVGDRSAPHAFSIANDGDGASDVLTLTLTGDFAFDTDACAGSALAAGDSCDFTITFAPTAAGDAAGALAVSDPNGPIAALARDLTGAGQAAAALSIDPITTTDFGSVQIGKSSAPKTFTVTNDGDVATGTLAVALDDATSFALAQNTCTGALAGRHSCTFDVLFTPDAAGSAQTMVRVSGAGAPVARGVGGTGLTQGAVDLADDSYDFGSVAVDASAKTRAFTVTNTGQVAIGAPTGSITPAGATGYAITATTCSGTLAAGAQCTITVAFDPAALGSQPAALVASATGGGSDSVALAGAGVAHVTVAIGGGGTGTVRSSVTGIDCPGTCGADFSSTPITLMATEGLNSAFVGWSPCDHPSGLSCTLDLTGARSITATFAPTYLLTVTPSGAGSGTVFGTGINCPGQCSARYASGTMVTLTASANAGSSFTGWSGECAGANATCTVAMSAAKNVTATFVPTYTLTVDVSGGGTVGAPGLTCSGATCTGSYTAGTNVTLTATPALGQQVAWTGCTASGTTCTVKMDQTRAVSAAFSATTPQVTITVAGGGSVASAPAGIACPGTCTATFTYGQAVTLTATPQAGHTFTGWSGACTGTGTCALTVTQALAATATFALDSEPLTVTKQGTGGGSITSSPAGISCGATCSASFAYGTSVTLTATPAAGSTFAGWGGACTGTGTCAVTLDQARAVTASFSLSPTTLTVAKTGGGAGTITSAPAGIDCGATCSADFPNGTQVTLTAAAATGSTFTGWTGAGCSGTGTCVVTVDQARSVTAGFAPIAYPLDVARTGNGSIASAPAGIACGATCSASFDYGTMVTLTATPGAGATFAGWTGACTGTNATCTIAIDGAKSVGASFTTNTYTLAVARSGTGGGVVTSAPAGIDCGATCSASFAYGTAVTLTATPSAGSSFGGWSGACTGTGTCSITIAQAANVTATFTIIPETLTITKSGTGGGTVSSSPAGISCGATCSASFDHGTSVTLSATPVTGSSFTGWSGAGCSGTGTCVVAMTQAQGVTATFTLKNYTLTVTPAGNGSGTVTSSPSGISCGSTCAKSFAYGTQVTLSAAAAIGSTFSGWSGGGCSGTGSCTITIGGTTGVTATFTLKQYTVTTVASPAAGGSVAGGGTYNYGDTAVLTATPSANYQLSSWTNCPSASGTTCTIASVTASTTVTANFTVKQYTVTTGVSPAGSGTVTGGGTFNAGSTVTLTAAKSGNYAFSSWTNCPSASGTTCTITNLQASTTITANFVIPQYTVTTGVSPAGAGTVTGGGTFNAGSTVTLTAAKSGNYAFSSWSNCPSASGTTCTITNLQASTTITANFIIPQYTVTAVASPSNGGSVTGGGTFAAGSTVTLTASPASSSWSFSSWTNCPSASGTTCTISNLQATTTITASFYQPTYSVTVSGTGSGTGGFSGSVPCPAGQSCTQGGFHLGDSISITAQPSSGSYWAGWPSYQCQGQGPTCTFTLQGGASISAYFELDTYTLTLGSNIGCASGCTGSGSYPAGTAMVLYGGYSKVVNGKICEYEPSSWTGCTPDPFDITSCSLTLDSDTTVSATFHLVGCG